MTLPHRPCNRFASERSGARPVLAWRRDPPIAHPVEQARSPEIDGHGEVRDLVDVQLGTLVGLVPDPEDLDKPVGHRTMLRLDRQEERRGAVPSADVLQCRSIDRDQEIRPRLVVGVTVEQCSEGHASSRGSAHHADPVRIEVPLRSPGVEQLQRRLGVCRGKPQDLGKRLVARSRVSVALDDCHARKPPRRRIGRQGRRRCGGPRHFLGGYLQCAVFEDEDRDPLLHECIDLVV